MKYLYLQLAYALLFASYSCSDLIEIDPPKTELIRATVFAEDAAALSAMAGVYATLANSNHYLINSFGGIHQLTGLTADEYDFIYTVSGFAENDIDPTNPHVMEVWSSSYGVIYRCNVILEALERNEALSTAVKQQLEGESRFLRALSYFYLVNVFGDVPLLLHSDFEHNALAPRTATDLVYSQVEDDLRIAAGLLPRDFGLAAGQRVRACHWAARALLARVYAYTERWDQVEIETSAIISHQALFKLAESLDDIFLANSEEAILQFYPLPSMSDNAAEAFESYTNATEIGISTLSSHLCEAFEEGDRRFELWIGNRQDYAYATKYKARLYNAPAFTEYTTFLRLGEQYLLRAEARAHLGDFAGGSSDLGAIRQRSGLAEVTRYSRNELMEAVIQERRVELFAEFGHRWFDLKRWGLADQLLQNIKPGWDSGDLLFPIPQNEINKNPNLIQNEGY